MKDSPLRLTARILSIACLLSLPQQAHAEEPALAPLTAAEQQALDSIEAGRVLSTVSFLAADELAGRDTPSKELQIAAAYVAARFRGAGLLGLADDGSFFQTHQLTVIRPPSDGFQLQTSTGEDVGLLGVLAATREPAEVRGIVIDAAQAAAADTVDGLVLVDDVPLPPQALSRPQMALSVWSRRVREFRKKGAAAVLVRPAEGSLLPELLATLRNENRLTSDATSFDFPVVVLDASTGDLTGSEVSLTVPAEVTETVDVRNVVGVLRGSDPQLADEAVLITAHLDHIGTVDYGADQINNGADDNATGVTGVITLADAFSRLRPTPRRSVIFMTFWGEEKGLLGSKHFAQHPLWPLDRIVANVNLEMIGRPEEDAREKAWMTGWKHSNLGDLLNAGSSRVGVTIFDRSDIGEMLYTRSDNASFVQHGVIAHSVSAGSLHSDYHQPGDEWTKLDIPHMTRVIQGLFAGVLPLADGAATPEKR